MDEVPGPNGEPGTLSDAEVDGLAAAGPPPGGPDRHRAAGERVTLALWHHVDDQYATAPPAAVTVVVHNLPFDARRARVRHWRVDTTHSNAYGRWRAMGRPQHPTEAQLAQLKARQGLEEGDPVAPEATTAGTLRVDLSLPLHTIALLEVRADL
jgi:xylan 1,4-beta-xylosidase